MRPLVPCLLVCVGAALGCSSFLPPGKLSPLRARAVPCGGWTATVEITDATGGDVVLLRDGVPVKTWSGVWGDRILEAAGTDLHAPATFEAHVAGGPSATASLDPVPTEVVAELRPPRPAFADGVAPRFDLWIEAPCGLADATWRASTDGWTGEGTLRPGGPTPIVLPPHPAGAWLLQVEVLAADGPVASTRATFLVGDLSRLDLDGDGAAPPQDCDETDRGVGPGVAEHAEPNARDDDCDGLVDEGTVVFDDDGDGLSEEAGDCDDADPVRRPGATEVPNCRDDDCDGTVDDGVELLQRDDGYERDDGEPHAWENLGQRRFSADLRVVSRDADDRERFRFWSDDGDWDSWGIEVVADRLPDGSVYLVEVLRDGAIVRNGDLVRDGDGLVVTGRGGRDDSGWYEVSIRPLTLYAPYCPAEFSILSR